MGGRFNILVPVTGTAASRRGAEVAIAIAQASRASLTALHVASGRQPSSSWRWRVGAVIAPATGGDVIIREVLRHADAYNVAVKGALRQGVVSKVILDELATGSHNLLVMGVSPRTGNQLSFGQIPAALLVQAQCSILFVVGEPMLST
jgi:nucleotide-binding universal stress UspA family protein